MHRTTVQTYGVLIALLAVAGLFVNDDHLLGLMNADIALDVLRIGLAAVLLYIGFASDSRSTMRAVLAFTGILYVGMGLLGLADSELWGLLPTGLTGFDIVFHLITGALALGVASAHSTPAHVGGENS